MPRLQSDCWNMLYQVLIRYAICVELAAMLSPGEMEFRMDKRIFVAQSSHCKSNPGDESRHIAGPFFSSHFSGSCNAFSSTR